MNQAFGSCIKTDGGMIGGGQGRRRPNAFFVFALLPWLGFRTCSLVISLRRSKVSVQFHTARSSDCCRADMAPFMCPLSAFRNWYPTPIQAQSNRIDGWIKRFPTLSVIRCLHFLAARNRYLTDDDPTDWVLTVA
ncbi:hypothetical protein CGRA01v4_08872 [Colletotrichum graminicola]|nr:hypothetical protein CGRA01v4_08872 [Colletotrichum graminicola]